jgi:N,N'-diacetyllegionaminate synthase
MNDRKPVRVIAEVGVNHNGDLDIARKLIDIAREAGADMVKFQMYSAERIATDRARKASYQRGGWSDKESQLELLKRLELPPGDYAELFRYCGRKGIDCIATAFDTESVKFLVELGQLCFKVPSGEITNLPYLRYLGSYGLPVYLSTGMATMLEVSNAVQALETAGTLRKQITVLHCTSVYPAPFDEINLLAMPGLRETLKTAVGYSDHSMGIELAIAAVALGAEVIEKHITLDREMPGPDQAASLEPTELRAMVRSIRNIEKALGSYKKCPTTTELENSKVVRKSIVAGRKIKKGERFSVTNLNVKRPGDGLSPMRWDEVMNLRATRDFNKDELIEI